MKRFATLVGSCLFMVACLGGRQPYTPVNEKTKLDEGALLTAAARALTEMDYKVAIEDPGTATVKSREREVAVSSVPKLSYKYQWTIETKEGTLSINVSCTENSSIARDTFEDCGKELPEQIIEDQRQLHHKILVIAKEWSK
jgi:hypothetical protein